MQWGFQDEINGVAYVLESSTGIRASIATKQNYNVPAQVHAYEQWLVARASKGTVYAGPTMQCAMAASPDTLLKSEWQVLSSVGSSLNWIFSNVVIPLCSAKSSWRLPLPTLVYLLLGTLTVARSSVCSIQHAINKNSTRKRLLCWAASCL